MKNKVYRICVVGAWRNYSKEAEKSAIKVGEWLAKNGHILVTGACLGIPSIVAKSYKAHGGIRSIGYSPANHKNHHKEVNGLTTEDIFHELIFMKSKKPLNYSERNIINIRNSDAIVLISGRMGALMEYTIAHDQNKPVGVLEGVGEASDVARIIELSLYHKKKSIFSKSVNSLMPKLISKIRKS